MKNLKSRLFVSAAAVSAAACAFPVLARAADTDESATATDIVVTAQRREQSVIDVPLSIQAMSGEQLRSKGINDLTSLQFTTPGYFPDKNNGFVQIYMRGIGNAVFIGADPSVATFVDDVPQIYGAMIDSMPDVERIEILKGAQGGLYGRNATGGVVNIITRQPSTDKLSAGFTADFGERRTVRAAAYLNVPLGDRVAWDLSVESDTHDAYIDNIAAKQPYTAANFPSGSAFGTPAETAAFFNASQSAVGQAQQDLWAARSKLLVKLTDDLSVTFFGSYAKKDDNDSGQFVSTTPVFNQGALEGLFSQFGIPVALPAGFIPGSGGRKWTTSIGINPTNQVRDYTLGGKAVWSLPGIDLTSITAYRNMKTANRGDSATSAVPFIPFTSDVKRDYFYEELHAVSNSSGPLSYLAGATYLENHINLLSQIYFLSWSIPYTATQVDQKIRNWSVYGEVGYDIADRLNLKISGRYMRETNKANFTLPIVDGTKSTQSKFVPSATLSYTLPGGGNLYARWARGFKTGGVNLFVAPVNFGATRQGSVFGPETVDTYEAGFKAALLDRKLLVTGAVFYNDYKNLQVDVRGAAGHPEITLALVNAKSARTWGIEGGVTWRAAQPLTLGANFGYLNAKYRDFAFAGSDVLSGFDLSGAQMPKAPKFQASFTGDLDQPITSGLDLAANVLVSHTSHVLFKYTPYQGILPNAQGNAYWLVNARIGVKTADSRLGLYLVADNLFDKVYYVSADAGDFGNLLNYGQRRIIKGEFTFNF